MDFTEAHLNRDTPVPLYYQLKELVISAIKSGEYASGSAIPTENELCCQFQISRTTVRQAITELVHEGWLYRIKSKGTFVSQPKVSQNFLENVIPFADQIKLTGRISRTEILDLEVICADDEISSSLGLKEGEQVIYLYRLRFADEEPIVTVKTFLPYYECSFILDHNLEKESLYNILSEKKETDVLCVRRRIEAMEANSEDLKYMGIQQGKPIQLFWSVGMNFNGKPIEYSIARYRGDRNSFEVTVFVDKDKKP